MYCKYSREALEMYCILRKCFEIDLCWNIEEHMKKCKYFTNVSGDKWLEIQNKSDDEFLRKENVSDNNGTKHCKQKGESYNFFDCTRNFNEEVLK